MPVAPVLAATTPPLQMSPASPIPSWTTTVNAFLPILVAGVTDTTSAKNQGYMNALIALGNLVEQAASASPGEAEALTDQALQSARAAKDAVRQLALTFPPQGDGGTVSGTVQRLMEAPVTRIEGMVGRLPSTAINSRGAAFCAPFRQLTSKYPFNPTTAAEASYDELSAMFQPNTGALGLQRLFQVS
jgi:type VI protein secretion system component VasK